MPIPKESLFAIQAAGAAVHAADTALKSAVQAYADHVRQSMSQNPFDLNTDSLFEEWKTVARLSQTLEQIEAELRKVHQAAQNLGQGVLLTANVSPRLRAPTRVPIATVATVANSVPVLEAIEATDVVVKTARKAKQAATKPIATKGVGKAEAKSKKSTPKSALSPNTQKLWDQLKTVLSAKKFTAIKRTKVGLDAGLPTGSVTASFTKLLENAYLAEDASGGLKLTSKK